MTIGKTRSTLKFKLIFDEDFESRQIILVPVFSLWLFPNSILSQESKNNIDTKLLVLSTGLNQCEREPGHKRPANLLVWTLVQGNSKRLDYKFQNTLYFCQSWVLFSSVLTLLKMLFSHFEPVQGIHGQFLLLFRVLYGLSGDSVRRSLSWPRSISTSPNTSKAIESLDSAKVEFIAFKAEMSWPLWRYNKAKFSQATESIGLRYTARRKHAIDASFLCFWWDKRPRLFQSSNEVGFTAKYSR